MVLFSPEKKRLRRNLINVYECPVLGSKQKELGSSQQCPMMGQEAMGQAETLIRKFHLNVRKIFFFPVTANKHWHRLPREGVGSASLEMFTTNIDMTLSS